jgi:hypothetical protein
MRILTPSLVVTAGLVLALGLLSNVSQHAAPDLRVATEAPSPGPADGLGRNNSLIACIVPPPSTADDAIGEDQPCARSTLGALSMEIQLTEC